MTQPPCTWCGEPDPDDMETLTLSPHVDVYRLIDTIVEAAAEQPRNDRWVETQYVQSIGTRELEPIAESVHPNSVLTLGEVKKAIKQVATEDLLRSKMDMLICSRCAESIAGVATER